jgi:transcriptional regulator with XRE-family HTH domain
MVKLRQEARQKILKNFADALGVSAKTINNYEAGTHAPRRIVINAWSLATGVPTG